MKDKFKRIIVKTGIVFLIILTVLTYFSKTIENLLLPHVKVDTVSSISSEDSPGQTHYLVPKSAVSLYGEYGEVFALSQFGDDTVELVEVKIVDQDDVCYEVEDTNSLYPGCKVVYYTNKGLEDQDKVYILE